jgi:hypothetical protein
MKKYRFIYLAPITLTIGAVIPPLLLNSCSEETKTISFTNLEIEEMEQYMLDNSSPINKTGEPLIAGSNNDEDFLKVIQENLTIQNFVNAAIVFFDSNCTPGITDGNVKIEFTSKYVHSYCEISYEYLDDVITLHSETEVKLENNKIWAKMVTPEAAAVEINDGVVYLADFRDLTTIYTNAIYLKERNEDSEQNLCFFLGSPMYINGDNKYVPCGDTKDMYF